VHSCEIGKRLSRRNTQSLSTPLLHNPKRVLICPELKVHRAFPRLVDLPYHPRHLEPIEDVDMLTHHARLVGTRRAKLLEQHEFLGGLGMLQCEGRFVAPFGYAAVGVDVDEIEGRAVPVLGYVGIGEFVSAA